MDVADSPDRPARSRRLSEGMPPPPPLLSSIRGHTREDAAILGTSAARGTVMTVRVGGKYRSSHDWGDICDLGLRILNKEVTLGYIRHHQDEFKVPYSTMQRWAAQDARHKAPLWLVERDVRGRRSLPTSGGVKGGGSILGHAAEKKLMVAVTNAAKAHCPYRYDEVVFLVRKTLLELEILVPKTGRPYTMTTDVNTLVAAFIRRCAEAGVYILEKTRTQTRAPAAHQPKLARAQAVCAQDQPTPARVPRQAWQA